MLVKANNNEIDEMAYFVIVISFPGIMTFLLNLYNIIRYCISRLRNFAHNINNFSHIY